MRDWLFGCQLPDIHSHNHHDRCDACVRLPGHGPGQLLVLCGKQLLHKLLLDKQHTVAYLLCEIVQGMHVGRLVHQPAMSGLAVQLHILGQLRQLLPAA